MTRKSGDWPGHDAAGDDMTRRTPRRRTLRLAVITMLGLGLAGPGLVGTAHAAYSGANGRIAFVRGGDIFTIQPNGTDLRRLTSNGQSSHPRWSPSGNLIAFVRSGNLWLMNADGSHPDQIGRGAPAFTDARPTWSPNGRYLAFMRTARGAGSGFLTRYDTVTHAFKTFVTSAESGSLRVVGFPTAVAWQVTAEGQSALLLEGTGRLCSAPNRFCLVAVTFDSQSDFLGGDPSLEYAHDDATRFRDPDWFPRRPPFATGVMVSVSRCPAGGSCTHVALQTTLGFPLRPTVLRGGYQAVFAPSGTRIAYVKDVSSTPTIFTTAYSASRPPVPGTRLATGTEPDWQPSP